jgi:hypothetical protein
MYLENPARTDREKKILELLLGRQEAVGIFE